MVTAESIPNGLEMVRAGTLLCAGTVILGTRVCVAVWQSTELVQHWTADCDYVPSVHRRRVFHGFRDGVFDKQDSLSHLEHIGARPACWPPFASSFRFCTAISDITVLS